MKRIGLILLACLMLALQTVAQAPEKALPDDLVVTAEIVNHEYVSRGKVRRRKKVKPVLVLSARMVIQNTTNHEREIVVMLCSWDWAWTSKGAYFICGAPGCDSNYPNTIIIPAGQAVEFYDQLCPNKLVDAVSDSVKSFQLGFADVKEPNYETHILSKGNFPEPVVYWSNILSDYTRPIATEEIKRKVRERYYGLVGEGK